MTIAVVTECGRCYGSGMVGSDCADCPDCLSTGRRITSTVTLEDLARLLAPFIQHELEKDTQ